MIEFAFLGELSFYGLNVYSLNIWVGFFFWANAVIILSCGSYFFCQI